jgi:hypothetical protein
MNDVRRSMDDASRSIGVLSVPERAGIGRMAALRDNRRESRGTRLSMTKVHRSGAFSEIEERAGAGRTGTADQLGTLLFKN